MGSFNLDRHENIAGIVNVLRVFNGLNVETNLGTVKLAIILLYKL